MRQGKTHGPEKFSDFSERTMRQEKNLMAPKSCRLFGKDHAPGKTFMAPKSSQTFRKGPCARKKLMARKVLRLFGKDHAPGKTPLMMRVTSDFFVSALVRRVHAHGGFAAVIQRGATEAGAVFIVTRDRLGRVNLYGPAAQTAYDHGKPDDRLFQPLLADAEEAALTARLERERRFDADFWIVELECGGEPVERLISLVPA